LLITSKIRARNRFITMAILGLSMMNISCSKGTPNPGNSAETDAASLLLDAAITNDARVIMDALVLIDSEPTDVALVDAGLMQDATVTAQDAQAGDATDAGADDDASNIELDAGQPDFDASSMAADTGTQTSTCVPLAQNFPATVTYGDATGCFNPAPNHSANAHYFSTGQAWGDVDNDGWIDLYVTTQNGANVLYRNLGDGRFEPDSRSSTVALSGHRSGGASFADFDNDGDQDLYVLNHGANTLFRNDLTEFVDITSTASVGDVGKGETASWGDYDSDGFLDLYVSNWLCDDCVTPPSAEGSRDRLYHNEGDGTFTDTTHLLGPMFTLGSSFSAVFLDIDNDNDLDLYTANDHGIVGTHLLRNVLWRNDGPGCNGWCFTEIGAISGADVSLDGMGLAVGDYDNDGDIDIFCTNRGIPILLRNNGQGVFSEVAVSAGVGFDSQSWGALFYDYNNDGNLDLYVAIGWDTWGIDDNRLFQNLGNGLFQDVNRQHRISHGGISFGAAYADYDKDGLLDLVVGNLDTTYRIYRNLGFASPPNHWIRYRLIGGGNINRDAIGARVYIELNDGRTLMQEVKSGSSLGSGNDRALHFGLGNATITSVIVRWPNGAMQRLAIPTVDQEIIHQFR
jgi:enediyne biosynthesis protein E4